MDPTNLNHRVSVHDVSCVCQESLMMHEERGVLCCNSRAGRSSQESAQLLSIANRVAIYIFVYVYAYIYVLGGLEREISVEAFWSRL